LLEELSGNLDIYNRLNELKQIKFTSDYKYEEYNQIEYGLILANSEKSLQTIGKIFNILNDRKHHHK
jgi:hypothetical protein